jgi:uncharacterized membrane protein YdjX (TVP38/TMEM64 family)
VLAAPPRPRPATADPDADPDAPANGGRRRLLRRVAGFVAAAALLVLVAALDDLHALLLRVVALTEPLIATDAFWGGVLFVVAAALSAMLAFVSSVVLVPAALQAWGALPSILLLWGGWILGGMVSYGVGRYMGRPVVRALTSDAALDRYEDRFSRRAPFGLVFLFQLALPSEIPGYVLGLVRYSPVKFTEACGLAQLPFAIGTVYLGESLLDRDVLLLVALGAGGALLSAGAYYAFRRRLRRPDA